MSNDLDRLMDLDPLELSAQDIDAIIAYQRKQRANFEAGIKPKRGADPNAPKINLQSLGLVAKTEPIKRRV